MFKCLFVHTLTIQMDILNNTDGHTSQYRYTYFGGTRTREVFLFIAHSASHSTTRCRTSQAGCVKRHFIFLSSPVELKYLAKKKIAFCWYFISVSAVVYSSDLLQCVTWRNEFHFRCLHARRLYSLGERSFPDSFSSTVLWAGCCYLT